MICDPLFYLLLPGIIAVSFMITGVLFHQTLLVEIKGWSLARWAASYPVFAAATLIFSVIAGWIVDRWARAACWDPTCCR